MNIIEEEFIKAGFKCNSLGLLSKNLFSSLFNDYHQVLTITSGEKGDKFLEIRYHISGSSNLEDSDIWMYIDWSTWNETIKQRFIYFIFNSVI